MAVAALSTAAILSAVPSGPAPGAQEAGETAPAFAALVTRSKTGGKPPEDPAMLDKGAPEGDANDDSGLPATADDAGEAGGEEPVSLLAKLEAMVAAADKLTVLPPSAAGADIIPAATLPAPARLFTVGKPDDAVFAARPALRSAPASADEASSAPAIEIDGTADASAATATVAPDTASAAVATPLSSLGAVPFTASPLASATVPPPPLSTSSTRRATPQAISAKSVAASAGMPVPGLRATAAAPEFKSSAAAADSTPVPAKNDGTIVATPGISADPVLDPLPIAENSAAAPVTALPVTPATPVATEPSVAERIATSENPSAIPPAKGLETLSPDKVAIQPDLPITTLAVATTGASAVVDGAPSEQKEPSADSGPPVAAPAQPSAPASSVPSITPLPSSPQAASPALSAASPAGAGAPEQIVERHLDLARDHQWLDRLARDITQAATQQGHLKFALNPANLGGLTVEIANSAAGTAIRFGTETDQARSIIADAQPRLVAELQVQGVRVAEAHVDLNHRQGGNGASPGQSQGQAQGQAPGQQRQSSEDHKPFGRTQTVIRDDAGDSASSDQDELYA